MSQIMITLNKIKSHDPCVEGWKKVLSANGGINADMNKEFPVSSILESNDLEDTLWVLRCLPEYDSLWRKFAWWCAKEVSHLTDDRRVHDCLDVVWRFSEGEATEEELRAAWAAASDATSDAARDAASDAAWAAARVAARAAASVAWAAAWAAASDAQKEKLRQIVDAGEWVE